MYVRVFDVVYNTTTIDLRNEERRAEPKSVRQFSEAIGTKGHFPLLTFNAAMKCFSNMQFRVYLPVFVSMKKMALKGGT